jgi:general secretion pathway protein C
MRSFPWFWLAAAVVAISLGGAAGPVVWHVLGDVDATVAAGLTAEAGALQPARPPPVADLAAILTFQPFGQAAAPMPAAPAVVPATGLGLTLLGLTLAQDAAQSRAIIAGGDLPVGSYATGDAIAAGVLLSSVRPDHVILMVNGAPEALFFADAAGAVQGQGQGTPGYVATATDGPPDPTNPDAVIAYYRSAILDNPQAVLDRLGLQATPEGYLIAAATDADVRRAGFQPGDLVTRVNGQPVGNVAQDQVTFDAIAASGQATVEVQRAGQTITMTFPLR